MNDLFGFLIILSVIGFIVGLIKPSVVRMKSRKVASLVFGGGLVLFFVLFGITSNNTAPSPANNSVSTQNSTSTKNTIPVNTSPKSEALAQITQSQLTELESAIRSDITNQGKYISGLTLIAAGGQPPISVDKDGNVDISIEVSPDSISSNSALNDVSISVIASQLVSDVFGHGYPISGMILGESYPDTDSYGNSYIHTLMALKIDNATYNKINWKSFNPATLCNLLQQQNQQGIDNSTVCSSLPGN